MNKRGMSLFELLIIIALISFILFCGFFYKTTYDHFILKTELDTLYMTFLHLAYKAYGQKKDISLQFDPTHHCYTYENKTYYLDSAVCFGAQENVKGPPSQPTNVLTHPITFLNNKVTFYADGAIQAGTVYLTNKHKDASYALSAPIAQISYLRRYIFHDGSWNLLT